MLNQKMVNPQKNYAADNLRPLDSGSEVVETMLASNIAKLIGLPTKSFCPAVITCNGCPSSNPWRDDRASKPASKSKVQMDWTLVEDPAEAYIVSAKYEGNVPNGVDYVELKNVKADTPERKKELLINREAWMLWVNFIQNTDMGAFNIRLLCDEYEKTADDKYECRHSSVYAHDYGHSFYRHLTYSKWSGIPVFQKSDKKSGCRAGLNQKTTPWGNIGLKGIILGAEFSSEARDILVGKLSRITDEQWVTLFQISRAEEATKVKSSTWLSDIKKKIQQMKSADCLPFDAGKSVLFN